MVILDIKTKYFEKVTVFHDLYNKTNLSLTIRSSGTTTV